VDAVLGWREREGDGRAALRYASASSGDARRMDIEGEGDLLRRGLVGDLAALQQLVAWLTPTVQVRCARALLASAGAARRDLREEVEDMAQEVFTCLFEHDARVLRSWDPSRGLSLRGFVGMVARRRVGAILAVRKRNPWYEEPMEAEAVDRALSEVGEVEVRLGAHQVLTEALRRTDAGLSERGRQLLEWMIRDGLPNEELRERTAMSDAALYQWRSRLTKAVREQVEALLNEGGGSGGVG
jgi:hypothetical protein